MTTKRIACLAASLKHGGFCYAGKDLATGKWVRPVSDDEGHAISAYYRVVGKNDPALVGDVLSMKLGDPVGENWQSENWEHVPEHWQRLDTLSYDQVLELADRPTSVWGEGRSTRWGEHDELSEMEAMTFDHSLLLIAVDDLTILCRDEGHKRRRSGRGRGSVMHTRLTACRSRTRPISITNVANTRSAMRSCAVCLPKLMPGKTAAGTCPNWPRP